MQKLDFIQLVEQRLAELEVRLKRGHLRSSARSRRWPLFPILAQASASDSPH